MHLSDVWDVRESERAEVACEELSALWEEELRRHGQHASVARVVFHSVRSQMQWVLFWKMGWLLFGMVSNVYLIRGVIVWFRAPGSSTQEGLLLALGFLLSETARSICVNRHWLLAVLAGVRLRAGARALLYRKSLRLRASSSSALGSLVQLVTGDTGRLLEACNYSVFLLSAPITTLCALGVMLWLIGAPAVAGMAILLLYLPLQSYLASLVSSTRRATARISDARTGVMGELLTGIRLLKLYGYEAAFADKIAAIRGSEVAMLRAASSIRAVNTTAAVSLTALVLLAVFAAFSLAYPASALSVEVAFTILALFNVARFPLSVLPQAARCFVEGRVACSRMEEFLRLPEARAEDLPSALEGDRLVEESVAVLARGASFSWGLAPAAVPPGAAPPSSSSSSTCAAPDSLAVPVDSSSTPPPPPSPPTTLTNLTFSLPRGAFCCIIGPVGCGKSSLLEAFLGQLTRLSGVLGVRGRLSYAPQTPWVFNASLRENILFGAPYSPQRYAATLRACALEEDVAGLPAGDDTEIGEKGVNLSGGQVSAQSSEGPVCARSAP